MKIVLSILLVVVGFDTFGQTLEAMQKGLDQIKSQQDSTNGIQLRRATEFAQRKGIPIVYTDAYRTTRLVGVDDFGIPIFVSTDNAKAAITTGVVKLRSTGSLGLNLEGNGVKLGVWDGGKVAHIEFGDRIIATEGANNDNHATHVTGTILASGINPDAKGMAPKASITSFDFSNDISEMSSLARADQTSVILSNHSYGFVTGWDCTTNPCQWRGNQSISAQEDYRFGFYSTNTRNWDRIANNAPYYLMVKSAGNDRSNGSGAIYPADCNGGSGYDCIEEQATAKNIFTVGAVTPVLDYIGPNSVVMSSFSGWGPTDDGRIKPDIVADGVGVFSTTLNNGYGVLSGTSMSAPNTTGSLTLIQELYKKLNGGNYMLSSTLKALAIHTAKEAGQFAGPDFSFGWGLLDVEAAASTLIKRDDQNIFVSEFTLKDGESYTLPIFPLANQKITATLVWNDPAGTPAAISLDPTTLMLVNDLDMRIVDDQGVAQLPWTLSPETSALGQAASKGDNFRDNVEKIEFENPEQKGYTIRIGHKRNLSGGAQQFSLILTYSSITPASSSIYWVGNSGDWNDPSHWSLNSGGLPANIIPSNQQAVFDEKSFLSDGAVSISSDITCKSLLLLSSSKKVGFALNGNTLKVEGDLVVSDTLFSVSNAGNILLSGAGIVARKVLLNNADWVNANLIFQGPSYQMRGVGRIGTLKLTKGSLDLSGSRFRIRDLIAEGADTKILTIKNAVISALENSILKTSDNLTLVSDSVIMNVQAPSALFKWNGINLKGSLNVQSGSLAVEGNNQFFRVNIAGAVSLSGNNQFERLTVSPGATLILSTNSVQTVSKNTVLYGTAAQKIIIQSVGNAQLNFEGFYKLCFDHLTISNVSLTGSASINAGINSTLVNAANWQQDECQNILFPNFSFTYPCAGGLTSFSDQSQGLITSYAWNSGDPLVVINGRTTNAPTASFTEVGTYTVSLTISNSKNSNSIQKPVTILANDLNSNEIIINGLNLFSREFATSYQWLRDGVIIPGANLRTFPFNGTSGVYTILTISPSCNRQSAPMVITGLENGSSNEFEIFPNPADKFLIVKRPDFSMTTLSITDLLGKQIFVQSFENDNITIDLSFINQGVYLVILEDTTGSKFSKRLMIKR